MTTNLLMQEVSANRKPEYEISSVILNRWSPRSMTAEPLTDEELFPLFEAARWAPSAYNGQLWRFIIARRQNRDEFDKLFGLLVPANQAWAKNAAALVVVASRMNFEHNGKPSASHAFDAGASWENLALEATRRGLAAHAMEGFDHARARTELLIPDDIEVHAMVAIGRPASAEELPERYRAGEHPSARRPLGEIVFEGAFGRPVSGLR
jgi:nitroreductase